jgi:hypothetical protein
LDAGALERSGEPGHPSDELAIRKGRLIAIDDLLVTRSVEYAVEQVSNGQRESMSLRGGLGVSQGHDLTLPN